MIKQFASTVTLEHFICLIGITIFAAWLLKTSLGRTALADAAPRRNNMPIYLPFIPLFVWWAILSLGSLMLVEHGESSVNHQNLPDGSQGWHSTLLDQFVIFTASIITIFTIVFLVRISFARRLKGFGLSAKTIPKDLLAAFVNLLSIWPLLFLMIILTAFFGKLLFGPQYYIQRHQELEQIKAYPQLPLRILIIISAVVMAPVLEELLFRGLFQTIIRSYLEISNFKFQILKFRVFSPVWMSVVISSIIFTTTHQNRAHWPALFILALCLGYAYEKSGSLFRPIFIHAIFNGITIAANLHQAA
jgi:membrane protease YdiL (CAAX protease family)